MIQCALLSKYCLITRTQYNVFLFKKKDLNPYMYKATSLTCGGFVVGKAKALVDLIRGLRFSRLNSLTTLYGTLNRQCLVKSPQRFCFVIFKYNEPM